MWRSTSRGLIRLKSPSARRSITSVPIPLDGSVGARGKWSAARQKFRDDADVAQLAEQPPRKWQVVGSNPTVGSIVVSQDIADGDACCKTLWTGQRPLSGW